MLRKVSCSSSMKSRMRYTLILLYFFERITPRPLIMWGNSSEIKYLSSLRVVWSSPSWLSRGLLNFFIAKY